MRLTSLLVPIFSAVVVADSSWSWFREDSAIDNLENPYFFSAPETLSAQTDSLPISNRIESTDLAKSKSVFTPDCEGFEYTLCCTGVQTKDWNEMDGVFYSITDCKKLSEAKDCHPENWYCCHQFLPGIMWIIAPQGSKCQAAPNKNNVV